jgi:hypothetical protein
MIEKSDKNKEAWTTFSKFISLRFGLCSNGYSTFDWFWKKEEFKKMLAILRKKKPDRTRALYEICRVQRLF